YHCYSSDNTRVLHSFPTRRSSDLLGIRQSEVALFVRRIELLRGPHVSFSRLEIPRERPVEGEIKAVYRLFGQNLGGPKRLLDRLDRKSTRLNSSHVSISYAVFCLK